MDILFALILIMSVLGAIGTWSAFLTLPNYNYVLKMASLFLFVLCLMVSWGCVLLLLS
jgi:hypothetical protein